MLSSSSNKLKMDTRISFHTIFKWLVQPRNLNACVQDFLKQVTHAAKDISDFSKTHNFEERDLFSM